ncbi:MAG: hypothetical protein K6F37_09155 [Lachnospiraceae bacterium]|nr:hypothetical protein [Lachnospiraceae bacterium]
MKYRRVNVKNISKSTIIAVLCLVAVTGLFTRLLKIRAAGVIGCVMFLAALLPFILKYLDKAKCEKRRFGDTCLYIEQLLYAFQNREKLIDALEETWSVLPDKSRIKELISDATDHILYDYRDEAVIENGLKLIEKEYDSARVRSAHRFITSMEQLGGNPASGVAILQKDRAVWQKQTAAFQEKCKSWLRNTVIAMLVTLVMCSFTPAVISLNIPDMSIWNSPVYQVSSAVIIIAFIALYTVLLKKTSVSWIGDKKSLGYEEALRLHKRVTGEKHDLGRKVALRRLKKEIIKSFSDWFIAVSIELQSNNVRVAIQNSYDKAPDTIKPALADLIDDLSIAPEEAWPYKKFLNEYEIPEVSAAMGMLFAISNGNGHDSNVQLEEILNRNTEITATSEELYNEDRLGGLYGLFLLPALIGAGKMLTDMTLILFYFLGMSF